jgi:hypothetical protein
MFYNEWEREPGQEHPIDLLVRQRVNRRDLERSAARYSGAILKALGKQSALWHRYEVVKGNLTRLREETYFDLGVEHGLAVAAMNGLQSRTPAVERLTKRLLQLVRTEGLNAVESTTAIVLVVWTLLSETKGKQK